MFSIGLYLLSHYFLKQKEQSRRYWAELLRGTTKICIFIRCIGRTRAKLLLFFHNAALEATFRAFFPGSLSAGEPPSLGDFSTRTPLRHRQKINFCIL